MLHADGMSRIFRSSRPRIGAALLFAVWALLTAPRMTHAVEIEFEAHREGEVILVAAAANLSVAADTAWNVLSDYDRLGEFIPGMLSSRVLSRDGNGIVVEQRGEFGVLFFRREIETKFAVVESPPNRIDARAIAGSFREMTGRYDLEPLNPGIRLRYTGRLVPDFSLPPLIGMVFIRNMISNQFAAMVDEIIRRDGLERTPASSVR